MENNGPMEDILPADHRVVYFKGGRAIEEAARLFPRLGELPDGGPDKFLLAVMHYCRKCTLVVCSFGPENNKAEILGKSVVEYSARPTSSSRIKRRLAFISGIAAFTRDALALRPTLIICGVDGPFSVAALIVAKLCGTRLIFSAHGALALPSTSLLYRISNKLLCRLADAVITHGPFVRQEAISLGADSSKVVEFNNGLDLDHIQLLDSLPPRAQGQRRRIVYVGRIEVDKGVIDLLDAFALIARDLCDSELHFVGSGSGSDNLKHRISDLGLSDRVVVHGPVPFEDVFRHFRNATVAVTPSKASFPEGFCKSAMEAMFTGCPVIAPDYGPFPYLVRHEENGLLYRADDVSDLSFSMKRAITNSDLLARITSGAEKTGQRMMRPEVGFARSLSAAFAISR